MRLIRLSGIGVTFIGLVWLAFVVLGSWNNPEAAYYTLLGYSYRENEILALILTVVGVLLFATGKKK